MTVRVFHQRLDARVAPADLATRDRYVWSREGRGFAAWGEFRRIEVGTGPDRFVRAAAALHDAFAELEDPEGVVAIGSFAFDDDSDTSVLVVPSIVVHSDGEASTLISIGEPWAGEDLRPPPAGPGDRLRYAGSTLPDHLWLAAVDAAVDTIASGALEKIVLARDVKVWSSSPFDQGRLVRNLASLYPECYTFGVAGLIGASPELLVEREGSTIRSRVLAGTAARGPDEVTDRARGDALMSSSKEALEHDLAVRSVQRTLSRLCEMLEREKPELLRLANVQHIATTFRGRSPGGPTALELAGELHPTAAVGGEPEDEALRMIGELERMDRDRYAGPVGWVDASGDGEWAVALRCGVFEAGRGRLFAGSGIVMGSQPEEELEETRLKLRAIRSALEGTGGGGSGAEQVTSEHGDRQVAERGEERADDTTTFSGGRIG